MVRKGSGKDNLLLDLQVHIVFLHILLSYLTCFVQVALTLGCAALFCFLFQIGNTLFEYFT